MSGSREPNANERVAFERPVDLSPSDEAADGGILQRQIFLARNGMSESSNVVRALEARVRALEVEWVRLHERLRTVGAVLGA
jgi:hypothetical protein